MDDKKNVFIGALIVLLLISAIWGQKEAGHRRHLAKENTVLHTQLKTAQEEAKAGAELQAELARQQEAAEQKDAQLENARKKIETLQDQLAAAGEQKKAAAAAEKAKESLTAESETKINAQQEQLARQQAALKAQEQKLASFAQLREAEQKQIKACQEQLNGQGKLQADLDELDNANKQLEEERNKVLAESDSLRAQVIGLEKIVEERSASLEQTGRELENCKINNSVLINQIAQQRKQEPMKKTVLPVVKSKAEQLPPPLEQQEKLLPPVPEQKMPQIEEQPVQQPAQKK